MEGKSRVKTMSMVEAKREPPSKKVRRREQPADEAGAGATEGEDRCANQSPGEPAGTGLGFRIAGIAGNYGGAAPKGSGALHALLLHISIVEFAAAHLRSRFQGLLDVG